MGAGIIISDTPPEKLNRYTWLKILASGAREYYEWVGNDWVLVKTEAAPATGDHVHTTLGDLNITGTLSANGDAGVTGQRVIQGYTLTFKKGLLVGFQAP
jgi:hypothetical protein